MMNIDQFKTMIDNLANHPKVKAKLDELRAPGGDGGTTADILRQGLVMLETAAMLLPIGKKGKQVALIVGLIGVLIELSILFKRKVLDDPDVQQRMQDAWAELERQSESLSEGAQKLMERVLAQVKSLKP